MSLGVLNNLSAIYAENSLNNTNNSLNTVLQQLSSGSKINSGADDSAGLSLVDGLQANSQALTQSQTNASEGVGLLTVADGALSQVTNLLNRAVTLATEASNGTLNSTQDTAANQEYQSILSEISNIGSTTTYNNEQVFNSSTDIYTGDSTTAGASVDSLNIRTLSSANLGDTSGVMSYSNGQSNVFLNLSQGGTNAAVTDSLNASGATSINVSYMTKGANGAAVSATANIAVGSGTSYANTAQGLISAINNAGLGLTATFTTAANAGSAAVTAATAANGGAGGATNTGIEISASGIGSNVAGTNGTGVVGALSLATGDTLGGTLSIVGSDGASHNITLGTANSSDTLQNLESTINSMGIGVTASINQAGTQMTFTSADSNVSVTGTNLTQNTASSTANTVLLGSGLGSLTVGSTADTLTGTLNLTEGVDGEATASTLTLGTSGTTDTLANLAKTINAGGYGITATLNSTVTAGGNAIGTVLSFTKTNTDAGTPAISGTSIEDVAAPTIGIGSTLGSLSVSSANDTLAASTLTINSGSGTHSTLTLGKAGTTDTLANLANTINNGGYGITATIDKTGTDLTFTQNSGTAEASVSGDAVENTYSQSPITIVTGGTLGSITVAGVNDTLSDATGSGDGITLTGGGGGSVDLSTADVDAQTLSQVAAAVNAQEATTGIEATLNANAVGTQAAGTILTFNTIGNAGGRSVAFTGTVKDNTPAQNNTTSVVGSATSLGTLSATTANDQITGSFNITEGVDKLGTQTTVNLSQGQTLAQIAADFNTTTGTQNLSTYGITASLNGAGTELTFNQASADLGTAAISSPTTSGSVGVNMDAVNATTATLTANNASDTFTGGLALYSSAGATTNVDVNGLTLDQIAANINNATYNGAAVTSNWATAGIAAAVASNVLTFTLTAGADTPTVTNAAQLTDTTTTAATTQSIANTAVASADGQTIGTLSAANAGDLLSGSLSATSGDSIAGPTANQFNDQTLSQIATAFAAGGAYATYGINATLNSAGTELTFTTATGDTGSGDVGDAAVALTGNPLTDVSPTTQLTDTPGLGINATLGSLTSNNATDMMSGTLTVQNGTTAGGATSQVAINGTLAQIAASFNNSTGANYGLGITATLNSTAVTMEAGGTQAIGTILTFTQNASDAGTATVTNNGALVDTVNANPANPTLSVSNPAGATLGTLVAVGSNDMLSGTLEVTSSLGKTSSYNFVGQTLNEIAQSFDAPPDGVNSSSGITASYNAGTNTLTFTGAGSEAVSGAGITDFTPGSTSNTTVATGTILDTLTVANKADLVTGGIDVTSGQAGATAGQFGTTTGNVIVDAAGAGAGSTLAHIADDFNGTSFVAVGNDKYTDLSGYGITATLNSAGTALTFSQTAGDEYIANVASNATNPLEDQTIASTSATVTLGAVGGSHSANSLTAAGSTDTLTGSLQITEGADTKGTKSTYNLDGQTLTQIAAAFNTATGAESNLGITAVLDTAGTGLSFVQSAGDAAAINVTGATAIVDQTATGQNTINVASGTMLDTLTVNNAGDKLGGTLNLTSGLESGSTTALALGTKGSTNTLANLATTINNGDYGITASLNTAGTIMTLSQSNGDGFTAAASGTGITDSATGTIAASGNLGTLTVNGATDTLTGTLTGVEGDGKTAYTLNLSGQTLTSLAAQINTTDQTYGILATLNQAGTSLSFTAATGDTGNPTMANEGNIADVTPAGATNISLTDTPSTGANSTTLGNVTNLLSTDTLSGSLTIGKNTIDIGSTNNSASTLVSAINKGNYGVTASYNTSTDTMTFSSVNSSMSVNTTALDETPINGSTATSVGALTGTPTTSSNYYNVGISGSVTDASTAGGTANVGLAADVNGSGGTATISYSDAAGQSLSQTDLSNQVDAETALTNLNSAISDVAAQDGYIGAQINTLNSVSSVLSTQSENVTAAQNAVQATDYATATSNMSKYQILSQTGIAALAQANSMQQEVLKLLQ